ncbi:uncharacterized protein Nmlp_1288 [Natronomonas moolapensis 8.8.11]|uniref:DUF8081 domain-containing protein n=1 Tax=Natronomonas moolapensis (strain DSM 18674 / CECT 7526 / JCM 14361 / 8.8.11) TaxID=268739 RepID=M1XNK4_NATM8|nr:hypothetical protein [Natronomonas moolapensis]CCQ35497.1 uncharacterized protein Nmlp_1288 [Natronomonas moolapensis 8.8.11]
MEDGYVVAAKPSARRASGTVGAWIAASGCHRRFDSKASACEFARAASPEGRTLWVQDAHPLDPTEADGYLLARRSSRRNNEAELPGEQVGLPTRR